MDRRSYNQFCGLAHSLDVVGERWTLLIVRNLLLGPQRYSELMRGLPGITTNLLAKRLREMEEAGLIERVESPSDAGHAYRLTAGGAELEPVVHALARWGWARIGTPRKGEFRSFDFLMVALRRRYRGGITLRAELVADGVPYRVLLTEKRAELSRGEVAAPDVRLVGAGAALARIFLDESLRKQLPDDIEVVGSRGALGQFLSAFAPDDGEPAIAPPGSAPQLAAAS